MEKELFKKTVRLKKVKQKRFGWWIMAQQRSIILLISEEMLFKSSNSIDFVSRNVEVHADNVDGDM